MPAITGAMPPAGRSRYHCPMKRALPWMMILLATGAAALLAPPALPQAVEATAATIEPAGDERIADANAVSSETTARIDNMLLHALSLIGVKYTFGGNSFDKGFDCSGFVRHVFAETLAIDLPRSSFAISKLGTPVAKDSLLPGDLLFYNTMKRHFSHVAIYLGEGRFVHAPSRGKRVEIVDMADSYWQKRFNGARRLVDEK